MRVLDVGSDPDDQSLYLVLEKLEGESLGDRLERGPLSVEETLELLVPILGALEAAHTLGVLHRDLKPDNIFLHVDGAGVRVPKLLDFGIAKIIDGPVSVQTRTGAVMGTPHYMSPEQAQADRTLGPPADVWSMGVIMYECLSGSRPFEADSLTALLMKLVGQDHAPLLELAPQTPEHLARAVEAALQKQPGLRPASAKIFAERLLGADDVAEDEDDPATAHVASRSEPRRTTPAEVAATLPAEGEPAEPAKREPTEPAADAAPSPGPVPAPPPSTSTNRLLLYGAAALALGLGLWGASTVFDPDDGAAVGETRESARAEQGPPEPAEPAPAPQLEPTREPTPTVATPADPPPSGVVSEAIEAHSAPPPAPAPRIPHRPSAAERSAENAHRHAPATAPEVSVDPPAPAEASPPTRLTIVRDPGI